MRGNITEDGPIEIGLSSLEEAKSSFDGARQTQGIYLELDCHLRFLERHRVRATVPEAFKLYLKRIGKR